MITFIKALLFRKVWEAEQDGIANAGNIAKTGKI